MAAGNADISAAEVAAIAAGVCSVLSGPPADMAHAKELGVLLTSTNSRAVGCWRHSAGHLELAGFLAVDAMPAEIQVEFVAATSRVALTQSQFGIVQAVEKRGPATNHRAEKEDRSVVGSIGWLGRFEAASSLAVPLFHGDELRGALAVATTSRIEPGDRVWRLVQAVGERFAAT